ncbi:hypothetical protein GCM10025734_40790 [Kitasatospora paranensis]
MVGQAAVRGQHGPAEELDLPGAEFGALTGQDGGHRPDVGAQVAAEPGALGGGQQPGVALPEGAQRAVVDGGRGEPGAESGDTAGPRADGGVQHGQLRLDGAEQEFGLAAEVPVERRGGDADLGRDLGHRHPVVAVAVELPARGGQDLRPPPGRPPDDRPLRHRAPLALARPSRRSSAGRPEEASKRSLVRRSAARERVRERWTGQATRD